MRVSKPVYHDMGVSTDLAVIDHFLDVKDAFLIDAGCGNMALSRALAQRGASVLGIDPDPVQALKNQAAETIPDVGFAQTGADAIPVENASVDGVLFPYSLHHVPAELYPAVFEELSRVLKPEGFIYAIEPVAAGDLNEVMRLFHDESLVRQQAQEALEVHVIPNFDEVAVIDYRIPLEYSSWEQYASRYAGKSYNTNYTEAQVRADSVRRRFLELGEPRGFHFESPMRVTYARFRKT